MQLDIADVKYTSMDYNVTLLALIAHITLSPKAASVDT